MLNFEDQVEQHIHSIRAPEASSSGKLVRVVGLTLEAKGISAPLGAHCQVETTEKNTEDVHRALRNRTWCSGLG